MHVANRICLADFADANRFFAYVSASGSNLERLQGRGAALACPKPCVRLLYRGQSAGPWHKPWVTPGTIVRTDVGAEQQTRCRPGFGLSPEPTTVTTQY